LIRKITSFAYRTVCFIILLVFVNTFFFFKKKVYSINLISKRQLVQTRSVSSEDLSRKYFRKLELISLTVIRLERLGSKSKKNKRLSCTTFRGDPSVIFVDTVRRLLRTTNTTIFTAPVLFPPYSRWLSIIVIYRLSVRLYSSRPVSENGRDPLKRAAKRIRAKCRPNGTQRPAAADEQTAFSETRNRFPGRNVNR